MDQRSKYFIHDKLVQKVYSDPREAIALLQAGLPEDLVNKIDWKSLRYHKKSYVDENFRRSESDLVYSVCLKGSHRRILLYFLFEHQSQPDKWMRFRLLKYMNCLWNDFIDLYQAGKDLDSLGEELQADEKPSQAIPDELPAVVSVVFYQGKNPWAYSTELRDLIDLGGLNFDDDLSWLPSFSHFLVDQSGYGIEDFQGELKGKIVQLLTRRPRSKLLIMV